MEREKTGAMLLQEAEMLMEELGRRQKEERLRYSRPHEKQLLFCFHSGYVGMGWFIPGVDIKRRAKGFKASSLKKYEDPPPCPPSLSQGQS